MTMDLTNPNRWARKYITDEEIECFSGSEKVSINPGEWAKEFYENHPDNINWEYLAFNTSEGKG